MSLRVIGIFYLTRVHIVQHVSTKKFSVSGAFVNLVEIICVVWSIQEFTNNFTRTLINVSHSVNLTYCMNKNLSKVYILSPLTQQLVLVFSSGAQN